MPVDPDALHSDRVPLPLLRLAAVLRGAATVAANVRLAIRGRPVQLEVSVPDGPAPLGDLLPIFQGLTNLVVDIAVQDVEQQGQHISCRKGCGACCRQAVPVSESEAHAIKRLVDALPEPRRSRVRARFAAVRQGLADAGLLDQVGRQATSTPAARTDFGLAYFRLGLACPFLEDESCSIHADRPLACREYLVTSPAEECARPTPETIRMVPLPGRVAALVRALDRHASEGGWVLLALAPEWAEAHPEPPPRPAPGLLQEFFKRLARDAAAAPVGGTP